MSILDDNFIERTDKLFLLGRWIPMLPIVSNMWTIHYNRPPYGNPIEVDIDYAGRLCGTMFDGKLTIYELWELIGGIEVSPDWVNNWNYAASQTLQDDMCKYNEMLNGELVRKIANELIKRFAQNDMHIMSLNEFDTMHMLWPSASRNNDWFCYEPGVLLHADWFKFPAYIKIMMTSNGIGFGLLYACAESISRDVCNVGSLKNKLLACPYEKQWEYDLFVLDLSPEKILLGNPRDIDEFMAYQQASNPKKTRYNNFNQYNDYV